MLDLLLKLWISDDSWFIHLGANRIIYNNNNSNIIVSDNDTEMMVLVPLAVAKTLNYQFCNWTYVKEKSTSQVFHPLLLSPLLSGKKQTLLLAIIAYIIPKPVVFFFLLEQQHFSLLWEIWFD